MVSARMNVGLPLVARASASARGDRRVVVPVAGHDVPVERAPLVGDRVQAHHLFDEAVDLSLVVVEDDAQVVELELGRRHRRLPDLPLLRLAVADHRVDAELVAVQLRRQRHPDRDREPLAERSGRRLDARREEVRGVALHRAAQPPQRRQQIAREVTRVRQHRVQRRDRVPLRQHEAVALRPVRLVRAVAHLAEEKRLQDVHRRQRSARVAAGRRGDRRQVVDAQVEGAVLERGQGLVIVRHCGGAVFPTTVGPSSEKRVSDSIAAQNSRPTPIGSVCAVPVLASTGR